jgi:hypothetical protein
MAKEKSEKKSTYRRVSMRMTETEIKSLFGNSDLTGHQLTDKIRESLDLPKIVKQTEKAELVNKLGLEPKATQKEIVNALRKKAGI